MNKWKEKFALNVILKNTLKNFTTLIQNVKLVLVVEVLNVTMRIKIKYQIKKIYILKKKEEFLQKEPNRYKNFKKLLRSYAELENKLKTCEEKLKNK